MTTTQPPGPPVDGADDTTDADTMIRSEERLSVALPVRVRGGVRVRKVVVTETITQTVQVRREHLVVDDLDVDDLVLRTTLGDGSDHAATPDELVERDFDLILHEERVVLETRVFPVERVRVRVRVVTDQVEIADSVRTEHIDLLQPDSVPASNHLADSGGSSPQPGVGTTGGRV